MKQTALFMLLNTSMISHSLHSQEAFRFGEWYGHLGLFPVLEEVKDRSEKLKSGDSREQLKDWLAE
jgi:hypothetical protein